MKNNSPLQWLIDTGLRPAEFWKPMNRKKVECQLCPRHCIISSGKVGFCKTRFNKDGELTTAIWGKLLTPSIEPIETEAVFHFWPGEKIFSLGNLGCNLSCDFCQNWESSNLENLSPEFVKYHTPEDIVNYSKSLRIKVLSFTYNDPVIWYEFVYETAKLARENGLKTLLKSAGFVSAPVVRKLTEVIDIFSISIKSINADTFLKMSKGVLSPVLEATQIIYRSGRHLEISNLIVPGLTDKLSEIEMLSEWIKQELDETVPVHFVRFHPCYKYTHVDRTSIKFLEKSRDIARGCGLKHVYIGNTFNSGHADMYCDNCGQLLIERFGLHTRNQGLNDDSKCTRCNQVHHIKISTNGKSAFPMDTITNSQDKLWTWTDQDTRNLHLQVKNHSQSSSTIICKHLSKTKDVIGCEVMVIPEQRELRVAIGQMNSDEQAVLITYANDIHCDFSKLMDRAHFPLQAAV